MDFYSNNALYNPLILIAEIVVCGIVPAVILTVKTLKGYLYFGSTGWPEREQQDALGPLIAEAHARACWVSLENNMACGYGVCLGCAAPKSGEGYALVCRAGPVFDASDVGWEAVP